MHAQSTVSTTISKETLMDSIDPPVEKKPLLLAKVKYTAKDCVQIDRKENKLILYNEA